jgi:hypothetical protein
MSEEKKNLLLALYDEPGGAAYESEPDLQGEAERLRYVKFHLDARPRARPFPETIEAIVRRASAPGNEAEVVQPDQGETGLRLVTWTVRLAATLVIVALAWIAWPPEASEIDGLAVTLAPQPEVDPQAPAESSTTSPTVGPATIEAPATKPVLEGLAARIAGSETIPEWDDTSELIAIQRRLEMLGALEWDETPVPLEHFPTRTLPGVNRGVIQARGQ